LAFGVADVCFIILGHSIHSTSLHPFSDKFSIRLDPAAVGNCQFEAISDQLSTIGITVLPKELRANVVSFLSANPLTADNTHLKNFLETPWNTYLENMRDCATYGDHITLQASAHLYDVQFLAMSSTLGQEGTRLISSVLEKVGDSAEVDFDKQLLFLGHYAETSTLLKEHYVSLSWLNVCDVRAFIRDTFCLPRAVRVTQSETDRQEPTTSTNDSQQTVLGETSNEAGTNHCLVFTIRN